jgi:hypothetical protein
MGLDVSFDCWHGGYGTFNVWRDRLAIAARRSIIEHDNHKVPSGIDWSKLTKDMLMGRWNKPPKDPLDILLCHYDCDGYIQAKHTKLLADRLKEILALLPEDGPDEYPPMRSRTKQFIDGLMEAHEQKKKVEFC